MSTARSAHAGRVPRFVRTRRLAHVGAAVFAALLGRAAPAGAQALQFRHLGVDDGLPSSLVSDMVRDRRGFMWIGTANGLSCYDGHRFRNYAHDRANPASLPGGTVGQVYEDHEGTLWAVTPGGVSRYDAVHDGFVTFMTQAPADDAARLRAASRPWVVMSVVDDARGTFWVGTSAGLYQLDRRTGAATRVALPGDGRSGAAVLPYVTTLYADREERVWVGTRRGLYQLDTAGKPPRYYAAEPALPGGLPDTVVRTLAEDSAGGLWVGTNYGGLARLTAQQIAAGTGRFERFRHDSADPRSLTKDRVIRIVADHSGAGLWVGTENGGLDYLDFATRRFVHYRFDPNRPSGIGSNSIWSLYQGEDGAVWVGTFTGGLDVSTPNGGAIRHYGTIAGDSTSLSYNAVPGFGEDRAGHIWVATDGGGLNRFDPATGRFTRYTPQNTELNAEAVLSVLEDHRGELWVSTWGGGISRFDPRRRRFRAYSTPNSDIHAANLYEVIEDRAGRLWIGTDNAVVAMFDRAREAFTVQYSVAAPGLEPSSVLLLRELRDGTFAVALRDGGVAVLDPATGATRHYVAGPVAGGRGLASNSVYALLEGEPGVLWVGTGEGLDRLDRRTGRCTHYGEADGLPSAAVEGILADDTGRLWISTDRGISRFDPRAPRGRAFRTYTRADGVQGGEFLMRSAFRAHDGTLYFGGNQGFTAIRPDRVVEEARRPMVAITGLQLFNRPVAVGAPGSPLARALEATDELTLTHAQNVVTFEFAAPDYSALEKTRYAYRLDGFDAVWQEVGHQHSASYTNLAPGRYTFRVRASAGAGTSDDDEGTALRLVITPPVWGTWWFRLLAAGAGAFAGWRLIRFQQRRRIEIALGRQALRDPLTGLANRALFRDRVEHALARLARHGAPSAGGAGARVAVLFLDLDNFKTVNDSLGHHAGDGLLCAVAARLLNATRGCDTVARLGGDEFAVLLENARGAGDAHAVAERIAAALRVPVPVGAGPAGAGPAGTGAAGTGAAEARVGASIGIAFAEPGVDTDVLLRNADAAMYRAKAEGKGRHAVFDPALVAAAAERLELERDLANALVGGGEFALVYQPIVSLATGAVTGAEALLRWRHATRGVVSPADFIPLAEASGLIVELGRWVLEEACRAAAGWPPGAEGAPVGVTVNVSGRQLLHPALPAHVAGALERSGLAPSRLTLEITESVLMHDTDGTLAVLRALKALGVRLAVDDFGTGYSSLRYLQQFPVDVLKIDKSFVDGVARGGPQGQHDAALARTIVALGEMLALRTVAEGVEHAEQSELLRTMGCDFGQGYLFARPLDGEGLRGLLERGEPVAVGV
ncbi:hypothetical protein tb265_06390 [Gemmatimonadetes bacterium T265]|nr:hypothetical protein tb265_06390 [Gemmatimonadetes bacterium T265]